MEETPIQISLTQRFFASGWLLRIWLGAFSLSLPLAGLSELNLRAVFAAGWHAWLPLVGASLLFEVVGLLLGVILACVVLAPLYRLRTPLNGGPFAVREMVVVLGGEYRGRHGRVYALWQGETVRVELGDEERASFRDIVGQHQLLQQ